MHRQIGAAFGQRHFQLFDEQAFAADLGQGFVQDLVALGGHAQDVHAEVGIERLQPGLDVFGLPHGQPAFAAGDDDFVHENRFPIGLCAWMAGILACRPGAQRRRIVQAAA